MIQDSKFMLLSGHIVHPGLDILQLGGNLLFQLFICDYWFSLFFFLPIFFYFLLGEEDLPSMSSCSAFHNAYIILTMFLLSNCFYSPLDQKTLFTSSPHSHPGFISLENLLLPCSLTHFFCRLSSDKGLSI